MVSEWLSGEEHLVAAHRSNLVGRTVGRQLCKEGRDTQSSGESAGSGWGWAHHRTAVWSGELSESLLSTVLSN